MVILHFSQKLSKLLCISLLFLMTSVTCTDIYRSFAKFIQTGSIQFNTGSFTGNYATVTIPFLTSKNDTNYEHALTYQTLDLSYVSSLPTNKGRYSLLLSLLAASNAGMDVRILSQRPNNVDKLTIRYLVIESSFSSYLSVAHYNYNIYAVQFPLDNSMCHQEDLSINPISVSRKVLTFLTGIDVVSNNDYHLRPYFIVQIKNSIQLNISLCDSSIATVYFNSIYLDILLIDEQALQTNYSGVFPWDLKNVTYRNSPFSYFTYSITLNQSNTFFGASSYMIQKNSPSSMTFQFSISGPDLCLKIPGDQSTGLIYIIFVMQGPCTGSKYWNQTSNSCVVCANGTYLDTVNFLCLSCLPNCQNCGSNSSCSICISTYYLYPSNSSCVSPCPNGTYPYNYSCSSCSISNCQTCSSATTCTTCDSSYYWSGSSCQPCISNCQKCLDGVACVTCNTPFIQSIGSSCVCQTGMYNNTNSSCQNCSSSISSCTACFNASFCTNCNSSFIVSSMSTCVCPMGMYNSTVSSCLNCNIDYCLACSSASTCTVCHSPYLNQSGNCILDCSSLSHCSHCTYDFSTSTYSCTACNDPKFQVSSKSQLCQPICGDGFIVFGMEGCDDSNTDSGDGCSNICTIEPGFNCTNSSNQHSNCTLISFAMTPLFNVKDNNVNQFTMSYSLEPPFLPIYSRVEWTQAITVNGFNATVSIATYDPVQNRLLVTVQYNQNIGDSDIGFNLNPPSLGNFFSAIVPSTVSCSSSSENNLKLDFYESNAYALAAITQALACVTAVISLLLFVAGYFGAKLIALECVATVQLSSLMLFTLKDVNPTFYALHFLGISLGRTQPQSAYNYQPQSLTPQFKSQLVSFFSASDYSISLITILLPIVVGGVIYAILQTKFREKIPSTDVWKFAVGEYTFYGLAFCSYSVFAGLAIDFRFCDKSAVSFIGIVASAVLALTIVGYCVYFTSNPRFLGEFKSRFERMNICQHFYSFAMIERMVNAFLIVFLTSVSFQAVGPLIVLSIELFFVVYRKPYVLLGWIRPTVIKSLMVVIVLLFLGAKMDSSSISLCIPLLILVCLLVCEVYSCVEIVRELKQRWKLFKEQANDKDYKKYSFEECQQIQLREFELKMMPNIDLSKTISVPMESPSNISSKINDHWQHYDKPYSLSMQMLKDIIRKNRNGKSKIEQIGCLVPQQQHQI